jgi:HlyD family secretion protein
MDQNEQNRAMQTQLRHIGVGLLGLALVVMAGGQSWTLPRQQAVDDKGVEASGVIQADSVSIASEFGGRIAEIPVAEGQRVFAGDLLVQLDTQQLDAQIEVMDATIELAKAALAQAKAGARPGQIAIARAQLSQAQAGCVAAQQAVSDTQVLVKNPQDINLQIAVTQAKIESLQHQLDKAVAQKSVVQVYSDNYWNAVKKIEKAEQKMDDAKIPEALRPKLPGFSVEQNLVPNSLRQAEDSVSAASAQKDGAEATLAQLYTQRANPQALKTRVDEAQSALAQAAAQVAAAQAQLAGLEAGATPEQIAALETRVAQAQAGRDALVTQRGMMRITSPISGTVMEIIAHPAEVAAQGATLLTLADTGNVILTVYVPETLVGQVHLDQPAQVTVDSFPGRTFVGRVSYISDKTEFTPRNVATQVERVNLVFAVEIRIANDDGALKPGMPADAKFGN